MSVYAYARVSSSQQHTDRQITRIKQYYPNINDEDIFVDTISGKSFNRPEWVILRRILRQGDELIISELDRLSRDKEGVKNELAYLKSKGIRVRALDIPTTLQDVDGQDWVLDMISAILIEVYSTMAQQELERREYRQRAGIEEAKKRGVYKGRKPIQIDIPNFTSLYQRYKAGELKAVEFMKLMGGLKPNTFYRAIKKYEAGMLWGQS